MPGEIVELSALFCLALGYDAFKPEAGIVNYYHLSSTLSGHQDRSEHDMSAPLVSISFGCAAVFLVGGASKCTRPVPVLLRSGDVIVMSGGARLAYHGVPKILALENDNDNAFYFTYDADETSDDCQPIRVDDHEWTLPFEYIKRNRINLNIRQVY